MLRNSIPEFDFGLGDTADMLRDSAMNFSQDKIQSESNFTTFRRSPVPITDGLESFQQESRVTSGPAYKRGNSRGS